MSAKVISFRLPRDPTPDLHLQRAHTALGFLELCTTGKYRLSEDRAVSLAVSALRWKPTLDNTVTIPGRTLAEDVKSR